MKIQKIDFNSGFLNLLCRYIAPLSICEGLNDGSMISENEKRMISEMHFFLKYVFCNLLRYGSLISYVSISYCLSSHKTYEKYQDDEKRGTHCFICSVKNSASEICGLSHNTRDILKQALVPYVLWILKIGRTREQLLNMRVSSYYLRQFCVKVGPWWPKTKSWTPFLPLWWVSQIRCHFKPKS